jgi:hypothetical protein
MDRSRESTTARGRNDRPSQVEDVLNLLCKQMAFDEIEGQMAFFLLKSDVWTLAAEGEPTQPTHAVLTRIVPADLSLSRFSE